MLLRKTKSKNTKRLIRIEQWVSLCFVAGGRPTGRSMRAQCNSCRSRDPLLQALGLAAKVIIFASGDSRSLQERTKEGVKHLVNRGSVFSGIVILK